MFSIMIQRPFNDRIARTGRKHTHDKLIIFANAERFIVTEPKALDEALADHRLQKPQSRLPREEPRAGEIGFKRKPLPRIAGRDRKQRALALLVPEQDEIVSDDIGILLVGEGHQNAATCRIDPVIAIKNRKPATVHFRKCYVARSSGASIFRGLKQTDAGISFGQSLRNRYARIAAAVIHNQHLDFHILLTQRRQDSVFQKWQRIEARHGKADVRRARTSHWQFPRHVA